MARPRVYTKLSPLQQRICSLMYTDKSVADIARLVGKKPHNVHNSLTHIFSKLGVVSRRYGRFELMARRIAELELELSNLQR